MKNREEICLDPKTSLCLKGVLACMVLICHLHARVDLFSTSILGTCFSACGYLAVSVFFFLSGFGLREASRSKTNYIENFPRNKLLPFLYICSFTIVVYFVRDICVGGSIDAITIVQSFLFGRTIVDNGWYLQAQMIFYLMFFLIYRYVKVRRNLVIIISFVLYSVLCAISKLPSTWYEAALCFPLGLFYSEHKDKFHMLFFKKRSNVFLSLGSLFLVFLFSLFFGNKPFLISFIRIPIKMISSLSFALLALEIVLLINIRNNILLFLGGISLEIYLLQGIFLNLFENEILISNDWAYMVTVTACTIVLSLLMHPLYDRIAKTGVIPPKEDSTRN